MGLRLFRRRRRRIGGEGRSIGDRTLGPSAAMALLDLVLALVLLGGPSIEDLDQFPPHLLHLPCILHSHAGRFSQEFSKGRDVASGEIVVGFQQIHGIQNGRNGHGGRRAKDRGGVFGRGEFYLEEGEVDEGVDFFFDVVRVVATVAPTSLPFAIATTEQQHLPPKGDDVTGHPAGGDASGHSPLESLQDHSFHFDDFVAGVASSTGLGQEFGVERRCGRGRSRRRSSPSLVAVTIACAIAAATTSMAAVVVAVVTIVVGTRTTVARRRRRATCSSSRRSSTPTFTGGSTRRRTRRSHVQSLDPQKQTRQPQQLKRRHVPSTLLGHRMIGIAR